MRIVTATVESYEEPVLFQHFSQIKNQESEIRNDLQGSLCALCGSNAFVIPNRAASEESAFGFQILAILAITRDFGNSSEICFPNYQLTNLPTEIANLPTYSLTK